MSAVYRRGRGRVLRQRCRSDISLPKQPRATDFTDNTRGIALRIQAATAGLSAARFAPTRLLARACVVAMVLSLAAGCDEATPKQRKETNAAPSTDTKTAAANADTSSPLSKQRRDRLVDHEEWDVYYVGGAKLGYGFTRWQAVPNHPELIAPRGCCESR